MRDMHLQFTRHLQVAISGQGSALSSPLLMLFLGLLSLICLSGLMAGVDSALAASVRGGILWLVLLAALSVDASSLFTVDLEDGSLDQDFIRSGHSYLPLIASRCLSQLILVFLPCFLIFLGLWGAGVDMALPLMTLCGLCLPLLSLRLLASSFSLSASRFPGAGGLLFLGLSSPLLFLAVSGQGALVIALGLIFAPLCLALVPISLSLSHKAR